MVVMVAVVEEEETPGVARPAMISATTIALVSVVVLRDRGGGGITRIRRRLRIVTLLAPIGRGRLTCWCPVPVSVD